MGLRINTNIAAFNAHKNLAMTDANLAQSMERLSSGLRINKAKDDTAGLAIANALRNEVRGLRKASENTTQAQAMLQIAEGAVNQIEGILERLTELANSARSSNTDSNAKGRLNSEFKQLVSEIDRISTDTKYMTQNLINGAATNTFDFQVGSSKETYDRIAVNLSGVNMTDDGLSINALVVDTTEDASAAINGINKAVSVAGQHLGTVGAAQSQLSFAAANLATSIENLAASESTIRDVDMAFEMVSFTKNQILLQAGTAMLAQANMAPQQVLSLFG
jgi:flagellin